jgi:hypothetical protein
VTTRYQVILIGNENQYNVDIVDTFIKRILELGLSESAVAILNKTNFHHEYQGNSPSVCLYFGVGAPYANIDILNICINDAIFVIPILDDLTSFSLLIPRELELINGFQLKSGNDIEALVGRILEALSLLRISRRLFISYRRNESRSVAIQVYEFLDQCGFDVFLDTVSVNPGVVFQDELWHRLTDTDVVVLLDTPGFLESRWTALELAQASSMSIGIVQLIWPNHTQTPFSKLCFPIKFLRRDFVFKVFNRANRTLTRKALEKVKNLVESIRARNLAARQDNLIEEFVSTSRKLERTINLQSEKYITLKTLRGNNAAIIPTVGVPQAFTYYQKEDLINTIHKHAVKEIYLLFDHRNIMTKWLKHLEWLDLHLPVKTIRVTDVYSWVNLNVAV